MVGAEVPVTGGGPLTRRTPPSDGRGTRLKAFAGATLLILAWLVAVAASPSPSPTPTPGRLPSTTTLSISGNLESLQYTVIATVSGSGPTPTGTVTFSYTRTAPVMTTVPLDVSGQASLQQQGLCCGEIFTYDATYSGDAHYAPSTAAPLTVAFHPPFVFDTTTTLVASPTSARLGQAVLLTATTKTVGSGNICGGGSTEFLDGSRALGTVRVDDSGVAVLSVTTLGVGTHQVTAQFIGGLCTQPGGGSPLDSTSAPVTVVVTAPGLPATGRPATLRPPAGPALIGLAAGALALLAFAV